MAPRVAVLVPVRDRYPQLTELLAALERQTLPAADFEVVVADDHSADPRMASLPREGRVRVVDVGGEASAFSAHRASNVAAAATRAPILARTDADCLPASDWLERGLGALGEADLVAGRIHLSFRGRPTLWGLLDLDKFFDQERSVESGVAATANLFLRRDVLESLGGFAEVESGGDYDLTRRATRAGFRLVYAPDAVIVHPSYDSFTRFFGKIWRVNARAGSASLSPSHLVPGAPLRARRRRGSLGLDRRRLAEHGIVPSRAQRVAAAVFLYLVIPYVEAAAQVAGMWRRRRT